VNFWAKSASFADFVFHVLGSARFQHVICVLLTDLAKRGWLMRPDCLSILVSLLFGALCERCAVLADGY
ncbi:MAG: hypothetical protein ACXV39_10505, partial [Halobacteriota archaeon]